MDSLSTTISMSKYNDDADVEHIGEIVRQLDTKLKSKIEEVEVLATKLKALEERERMLKRYIDARDNTNLPINNLPLFLLRQIFILCLPFYRTSVMSNREAPIQLGQVCSKWRHITLDTPELWASIHIPLRTLGPSPFTSDFHRKREEVRRQAVSSWLRLSKDLPLWISLTSVDPDMAGKPAVIEAAAAPYLEILSSFSSRWRAIYFMIDDFDWTHHFFSRYKSVDLPLLEKLHIDGSKSNVGKVKSAQVMKALGDQSSLLQSPNLRWVTLPVLGELTFGLPFQWSRITRLNFNGICDCPLFQVMETLAQCLNLEHLHLCFNTPASGVDLPLERNVELPQLSSLWLTDHCTSYNCPRFLDHLISPNLRSFCYDRFPPAIWLSHIITRGSLFDRLFVAFQNFVYRTPGPIEQLSLQYDWLANGELAHFLSLLPDLKRLSLRGNGRLNANSNDPSGPPRPLLFDDSLLSSLLIMPETDDIVMFSRDICDFTEIDSDSDYSDDESERSNDSDIPMGITRLVKGDGPGEAWKETYNFFCPRLEVLQCTNVAFSAEDLLNVLQSRTTSDKRFGISRIRAVDVVFELGYGQPEEEILNEIKEVAKSSDISVFLHFQPLFQPKPLLDGTDGDGCYTGIFSVGFPVLERLVYSGCF